jgi:cell division protein FtsX
MNTFFFLFRELLGAVRPRSGGFLILMSLLIFVFLGSFASLFLFVTPADEVLATTLEPSEVGVRLSPRLTSVAIDALYYAIQERSDVAAIRFEFAQESDRGGSGGLFVVQLAAGADIAAFSEAVGAMEGVIAVDSTSGDDEPRPLSLAASIRVALLLGLVVSAVLSLVVGRIGFRRLLEDFSGEIRLLRLSGIAPSTISPPIIALGVLLGLLSGLLIVAGISLLHVASSVDAAYAANGLTDGARVIGILLVDILLGAIMGGLTGLLGASLLSQPGFTPMP